VLHNENRVKGRVLALDLGRKRIGIAVSDALGITAQGLPTLQRTTLREDAAAIDRIAAKYDVGLILFGLPLHMDGNESRQSGYTREFAQYLTERIGRAVDFWDERMTSIEANRVLKESGISIAKRAKAVDKLAAQILLESFLASEAYLQE
jgi:putative Holliday junction resolvase